MEEIIKDSTVWEEFPEDLEWRVIPGFKDYEINNYGDIISYKRGVAKYLSTFPVAGGRYLGVHLGSQHCLFYIHQLVALTFIGTCPEDMEVAHKDGNNFNNHVSNLEYKTHLNNMKDTIEHDSGLYKLTDEQVVEIKKLLGKKPIRLIAKQFKVTEGCIYNIRNGERRKDI